MKVLPEVFVEIYLEKVAQHFQFFLHLKFDWLEEKTEY